MTEYKYASDVLDTGEELERKVVETLEQLQADKQRGLISDVVYQAKLRTINDCTRGLIDSEISFAVDDAILVGEDTVEIDAFVHAKNKTLTLTVRQTGDDKFVVCTVPDIKIIRKQYRAPADDYDPVSDAYKKLQTVWKKLLKGGYVRLGGIL